MKDASPYQVLADCPHCLVEGAVIELMDPLHPACHMGVPSEVRCRLCAWTVTAQIEAFAPKHPLRAGRCPACHQPLDEAARTGRGPCPHCGYTPTLAQKEAERMDNAGLARVAISRWAREDGNEDLDDFCRSNLGGLDAGEVIAQLGRREPITTSFDVIAFLFPSTGLSAGGGRTLDAMLGEVPAGVVDRAPEPPPFSPEAEDESADESAADNAEEKDGVAKLDPALSPGRLLASVIVADGELRAGEREFANEVLARENLTPIQDGDLRVWRPHELARPSDRDLRERLLEASVHLCYLDRERDESEWKVILAYSRDWGVPSDQINEWAAIYAKRYTTSTTRLWQALSRLVRVR